MSIWKKRLSLVALALLATPLVAAAKEAPGSTSEGERLAFFEEKVQPLLKTHCLACHSGAKPKGGLRLTSRESILTGGDTGPAVSLEKPEDSLLLEAVRYESYEMPPKGKLPQEQIDTLTRWIALGLPYSPEAEVAAEPHAEQSGSPQVNETTRSFWSFRPLRRPEPPAVKDTDCVANPIDCFVLARLEDAGLRPNPQASRATLIRRAHYNLLGLPPAPEEVHRFVEDNSPGAYERMVDSLLESPHYGEKWGRFWLDLVRWAETNSYERDDHKPGAWRYRDYVIESFNEDKPYDRFVLEQLAGDEIEPFSPAGLVATGYYRLGIWDDEPTDALQARYDDLDDIVATTSQVFLGLTMNCARCHDHKLDPVPQKDYYRFLAFFNGLTRYGGPPRITPMNMFGGRDFQRYSQRPIAPPDDGDANRRAVAKHRFRLGRVEKQIKEIEDAARKNLKAGARDDFKFDASRVDVLKRHVPEAITEADLEKYIRLREERDRLRENAPEALAQALCVTEEGPQPRETHVLVRGNAHVEGELVDPGFPQVLSPPEPEISPPSHERSSGRRMALARWVASRENPLTARVMANRVWQGHFGRGIVRSPNNFGLQGDAPTHPELLDWLAAELIDGGWRLKRLHKRILMSSAWRMSSADRAEALSQDPENDLFWRVDMRRLTAEEFRDSILAVNGTLNPKMGGPSFYPVIPPEVLAGQSRPGSGWGQSSLQERRRRSVYIYVKRSLIHPLIAAFDGPETDFTCPQRFATTQPTQALGTFNGGFLNEQAQVLADYVQRERPDDTYAHVRLCLARVTQREVTGDEVARGVALIESLQAEDGATPEVALRSFCLVALNLNEFLYLD